jgi:hypothetical protein
MARVTFIRRRLTGDDKNPKPARFEAPLHSLGGSWQQIKADHRTAILETAAEMERERAARSV